MRTVCLCTTDMRMWIEKFMDTFFPIPFYLFCKTIKKYGGLSGRGLFHALPWIVKTTAFEPFRWIELALYNKKIKSSAIETDPLFILGYYRSGTTYLQNMFMHDNRLGYTSIYQTIFPELMLAFEKRLTPFLEKISKAFKMQNHFHRIPFTWYSPGEEDVAMISFINVNAAQWGVLFPEKAIETFTKYALFENISPEELHNWKNSYLYLIKKISIVNNGKPLVLKSPLNTARVNQLLSLFPNAKFVYISRNPVHVYASSKRLWEMIIQNYILGRCSAVNIQQIIIDTYSRSIDSYMKYKLLIPQGRLIEISYEDFIMQPIDTIKQIYDRLSLGNFDFCNEAMNRYVLDQQKYKTLKYVLDQKELNLIEHQLAPYIHYWSQIKE